MSCYSEPGFVLLALSRQPVTANTSLHTSDDTTAADIYRSWNFPSWVWVSSQMPVASCELLHGAKESHWLCFCAQSKHVEGKKSV